MLFVANAFHFAINFFRGSHPAPRRVYVDNNRLDGIVIPKFFKFFNNCLRIEDHAFQINHADLVPKTVQPGTFIVTSMHGQINQGEYRQYKKKESSSPNQDPEPCAGTSIFRHKSGNSLASDST